MYNPNAVPETVRVKSLVSEDNPLGYVVINKDDLAADHELFDEAPAKPEVQVTPSWQQK